MVLPEAFIVFLAIKFSPRTASRFRLIAMKRLLLAGALLVGTASADEQAGPLIKKLGSEHYPTRETAHKELSKKTDQDSIDQLLKAMKSPDMEVARRAELILKPYLVLQKEKAIAFQMEKTREALQGKFPWIDCGCVNWQLQQMYMGQAQGSMGLPDYSKYRHATELMIHNLLKNGQPVDAIIEELKAGELRWIENHNRSSSPKIPPTWK